MRLRGAICPALGVILGLVAMEIWTFAWGGDSVVGKTRVALYRGDKQAAFSWQFDDSAPSQADFAIPHLNARGLRGTFFINPGTDRYKLRERNWVTTCPLWDQELANHSLHHQGAKNFKEAQREVGEVSKLIWKLYPHKSRLLPFKSGGATSWKITKDQWAQIQKKYPYFNGGTAINDDLDPSGYDPMPTREALFAGMDKIIAQKGWAAFQLHGVGPIGLSEWLPTNGELFDAMLDKLVMDQDKAWTAPEGEVYRYTQERDHFQGKILSQKVDKIELELVTPNLDPKLYIEPLTLFTEVPGDWKFALVKQGDTTLGCRKVQSEQGKTVVMYDASPNQGMVILEKSDKEAEAPSDPTKPDIFQIRRQVACPILNGLTPSSLIDGVGNVRGYVYKGKDKAVAALWYWGPKDKTRVTLHDYKEAHMFLKPDNRHIDVKLPGLETIKIVDGSGKELTATQGKTEIALELASKPIYLVGNNVRLMENLILYGFTDKPMPYESGDRSTGAL